MTDMILTYVPESEYLIYTEAQALALKRDRQAAEQLRLSMPESKGLLITPNGYVLAPVGKDNYIKLWRAP